MKKFLLAFVAAAAFAFPAYAGEGLTAEKAPVVDSKVEVKAAPAFALTEAEQTILDNVNAARKARGLANLEADPILTQRARNHAAVMHARGMHHSAGAWENVAKGQRTPLLAFRTWMASGGHYANMMSRRATHIGIGVSNYSYVQQFAARSIQPAATVGQPIQATAAPAQCANGVCSTGACATTSTYGGKVTNFLSKFRILKNRRG